MRLRRPHSSRSKFDFTHSQAQCAMQVQVFPPSWHCGWPQPKRQPLLPFRGQHPFHVFPARPMPHPIPSKRLVPLRHRARCLHGVSGVRACFISTWQRRPLSRHGGLSRPPLAPPPGPKLISLSDSNDPRLLLSWLGSPHHRQTGAPSAAEGNSYLE